MNSGTVGILIFAIILIVGGAILLAIATRGQKQLNKQEYRTRWLKIESSLKKAEESSYHLVILNADKLLDAALKELGYKGQTMGERMKSAKGSFSDNNAVWSAHKLRNQIAHETDVKIGYTATRRALASFKRSLRDLGAI